MDVYTIEEDKHCRQDHQEETHGEEEGYDPFPQRYHPQCLSRLGKPDDFGSTQNDSPIEQKQAWLGSYGSPCGK